MKKQNRLLPVLMILLACAAPAARGEGIAVTVQQLSRVLVDQEYRAPATVMAANRADIKSEVSALVSEVIRDVGDDVSKGDVLIRLDDANARLALAQARASLAAIEAQITEARSRVVNAEELLGKNFISDEELIARRANLAVLQANKTGQEVAVKIAELDLARTRIRAPFDGAIVSRQAQAGSYAQPGTLLITVVQTSGRELDVEVDPRYASDITGASAFRFVSQGDTWPVELLRLSSVIDISSRLVRARFRFAGDPAPIGTSGQLVWSESSGVVPVDLIVQRGSQLGVFVAENNIARFVPIPSAQEGRPAPVNLSAETLLVMRGHVRLQDGDQLAITRE